MVKFVCSWVCVRDSPWKIKKHEKWVVVLFVTYVFIISFSHTEIIVINDKAFTYKYPPINTWHCVIVRLTCISISRDQIVRLWAIQKLCVCYWLSGRELALVPASLLVWWRHTRNKQMTTTHMWSLWVITMSCLDPACHRLLQGGVSCVRTYI